MKLQKTFKNYKKIGYIHMCNMPYVFPIGREEANGGQSLS